LVQEAAHDGRENVEDGVLARVVDGWATPGDGGAPVVAGEEEARLAEMISDERTSK
jgi:hypothetical protein